MFFTTLGFKKPHTVSGRHSVADLFKPGERCGVYILGFENGQFYVGLATDFVRRYAQHSKVHLDIQTVFFKKTRREHLVQEERRIAQILQNQGFGLRNILLVSIVEGETDFDLLLPIEEQSRFLDDLSFNSFEGEKFKIEEQRIRYSKSFDRLKRLSYFSSFIEAGALYVETGIPIPLKSEYSFWCVSCPSTGYTQISRFNIYWQEVCTFLFGPAGFEVTFHLAKSPLEAAFGSKFKGLFNQVSSLEFMLDYTGKPHTYEPGGQDQISFTITDYDFEKFIKIEAVRRAIRTFNLRLMRKGATIFNRYHSFDLSDAILKQRHSGLR